MEKSHLSPPRILLLALVTCGIVAPLLLLELCVRVAEQLHPRSSWSDRPTFFYKPSSATNLQGNVYQSSKPTGTFRIAVVGDSISFAPHVQFDDTFSKRLERMLNIEPQSRRVEVINYGVPGYSTLHEEGVVRTALNEGADLIVLQVTLNDPEITPLDLKYAENSSRFGPYKPGGWMNQVFKYWHSGRLIAGNLHNRATHREYTRYFFDLFENPTTRGPFDEALARIAGYGKQANKPMIGFLFPLFAFPLDDSYPFKPLHEQVAQSFAKNTRAHRWTSLPRLSVSSCLLLRAWRALQRGQ